MHAYFDLEYLCRHALKIKVYEYVGLSAIAQNPKTLTPKHYKPQEEHFILKP